MESQLNVLPGYQYFVSWKDILTIAEALEEELAEALILFKIEYALAF